MNTQRQHKYCSFPSPYQTRHGCQPNHLVHRLQKSSVMQNIPWKSQFHPHAMRNGTSCGHIVWYSWSMEPRSIAFLFSAYCPHTSWQRKLLPLKGLHWQPEGRQLMEVRKGARYHFACSTLNCSEVAISVTHLTIFHWRPQLEETTRRSWVFFCPAIFCKKLFFFIGINDSSYKLSQLHHACWQPAPLSREPYELSEETQWFS